MATYYVVPLGHDYDDRRNPTSIGPATALRCEHALKKLRWFKAHGHEAFMVLPTPSFRTTEGLVDKTMGLMMYEWFLTVPRASDVEYIVNRTEREFPHTTYGELLWGLPAAITHRHQLHVRNGSSQINDLSDTTIVIVSNERHLKRIRWVIRLMLPQYLRGECRSGFVPDRDYTSHYKKPCILYEASGEPLSSVGHEILSYSKLILMWLGVVKP